MASTQRETNASTTHLRILDAALDLFEELGYEATTVDQITARAAVGRRTFFRYFPNKEALLLGEVKLWGRQLLGHLETRPAGEAPLASLLSAVRAVLDAEIDLARQDRIRRLVDSDPALTQRHRAIVRVNFETDIVGALAHRHPECSDLELRVLSAATFGGVQAALHLSLTEGAVPTREYFDAAVQLIGAAFADQL